MAIPTATAQWTIKPSKGFDGLQFNAAAPIPTLSETACLIRIEAITLNYRDIAMPLGVYPISFREDYIPCSDAAGTVIATGSKVSLHKVGDQVCSLFIQGHQKGLLTPEIRKTTLGSLLDGVLRQYAVFDETGLVTAPEGLSSQEIAALPCAALTAWNALTGLKDRAVQAGDYVLTQGTGGVSLFAIQIAIAKGAKVIATTSSNEKVATLKALGAHHIINYKEDPDWGQTAKDLTPGKEGVHHIIEVGGDTTVAQSLDAIRCEGVISIIGFLGGDESGPRPRLADALHTLAIVRGVHVGSKEQAEELHSFISQHQIKPVLDQEVFPFHKAKEAFEYLQSQKHLGKVVINVGDLQV